MGTGSAWGTWWCFEEGWDFDGGTRVLLSISTSMLLGSLSLGLGLGMRYHL